MSRVGGNARTAALRPRKRRWICPPGKKDGLSSWNLNQITLDKAGDRVVYATFMNKNMTIASHHIYKSLAMASVRLSHLGFHLWIPAFRHPSNCTWDPGALRKHMLVSCLKHQSSCCQVLQVSQSAWDRNDLNRVEKSQDVAGKIMAHLDHNRRPPLKEWLGSGS